MLAESIVAILLLALLIRPIPLDSTTKFAFLLVAVYLTHLNIALGCLAAIVLVRSLQHAPAPSLSLRPPRIDRLGIDSLLQPQESFFKPVVRAPGDPVAEILEPYSLF